MKLKIATTTAAVLLGVSSMASANPPAPPSIYNTGPVNPVLNMTNMRDTEKAAFALYEGLMQATEALIYVNGCNEFSVPVTASADGINNSGLNYIQVGERDGVKLEAVYQPAVPGFGQNIDVAQNPVNGYLNDYRVNRLRGRYTYNNLNNLMVNERTSLRVTGQLGLLDRFFSTVIKDFYHGNTYTSDPGSYYEIFDYGLQSLSKSGYPVNKWWQRSKAVRDNGQQGCTVFQKDRLVGVGACRITLATVGYSQPGFFFQNGFLSVAPVNPTAANDDMTACTAPQ